VCFMHKGMYLINLLIVQKHNMRVGDTGPSQHKYLRGREEIRRGDIKRKKIVSVTVGDKLGQKRKDIAIIIIMCQRSGNWRGGRGRIRNGGCNPRI